MKIAQCEPDIKLKVDVVATLEAHDWTGSKGKLACVLLRAEIVCTVVGTVTIVSVIF